MTPETDTTIVRRDAEDKSSALFGVSVRAWLALTFVLGVVGNQIIVTLMACAMAYAKQDVALLGTYTTIGEPFATLSGIAVGFYFWQKLK